MPLSVGATLPEADLIRIGEDGPETVSVSSLTKGKKVALFAVPGAYTPTCHSAHLPSFMRVFDRLKEKGVDDVICVAVNDPFVMRAWGEETGATRAGIHMLSDASSQFAEGMGMAFDAPPAGLIKRSQRYALYADDGVIKVLNAEESPGECDVSGGEALLDQI